MNDLVNVGNLNLSVPTGLTIKMIGTSLTNGTYTLINYSGSLTGSVSNLTPTIIGTTIVPSSRSTYLLGTTATSNGSVTLTVNAQPAASLTWTGNGTSNVWDLKTTANFKNGSTADVFYNADSVTFNDTGSSSPAINVTGTLIPGAITVNNTSSAYTFAGTGSITGSARLTKNGSGTLTITNSNSYTGGTALNSGQINLNNPSAIGTATLIINGGAIDNTSGAPITLTTNNPIYVQGNFTFNGSNDLNLGNGPMTFTNGYTINVAGTSALTIGGGITSTYGVTKGGSGTLVLTGVSQCQAIITAGTLTLGDGGPQGVIWNYLGVNGGVVNASTNWSLGYSSGVGSISISGGTLNFYGSSVNGGTIATQITMTGGAITGSSFDWKNSSNVNLLTNATVSTATISSGMTVSAPRLTLNVAKGSTSSGVDLLISGAIGTDSGAAVVKIGSGTAELSGTNTYTSTSVAAGTLIVSGSISGTTSVIGGTLIVSGSISGTTSITGGTLRVVPGGNVPGAINVGNSGLLQADAGAVLTGAVTVNAGGAASVGQNGPGAATIANNLTLNPQATLSFFANGPVGPTQYGQLVSTNGTVTLGGKLSMVLNYNPAIGDVFYILLNSSGSSMNGTFSNVLDNGDGTGTIQSGNDIFLVSYSANHNLGGVAGFAPGQGNDVALLLTSIVPEPGVASSLLLGTGCLAGLGRFRRRDS